MTRPARLPLLAMMLVLVGASTTLGQDPSAAPAATDAPASVSPSPSPLIPGPTWTACADPVLDGFECATLTVPVDWGLAETGLPTATIDLALARHLADGGADERIGTLVLGPEAPGDAATLGLPDRWSSLPTAVRDRFDVLTWDPRGTGRSMPLRRCPEPTITIPATGAFDIDAVLRDARSARREATRTCAARNGEVMSHMGSRQSARDLDAIRSAIGGEPITFMGTGYGARLGAIDAATHPRLVRALVLDGPPDPFAGPADRALDASTIDLAIAGLLQTYSDAAARLPTVLDALDTRTITLPSGSVVTRWSLIARLVAAADHRWAGGGGRSAGADGGSAIADVSADADEVAALIDAAAIALGDDGDRTAALATLDAVTWPTDLRLGDAAGVAAGCADEAERLRPGDLRALADEIDARAPIAGWLVALGELARCEGFRFARDPIAGLAIPPPGVPTLIIGRPRAADAPYANALAAAAAAPQAALLTDGGSGSRMDGAAPDPCVGETIAAFLIDPTEVARDVTCPGP